MSTVESRRASAPNRALAWAISQLGDVSVQTVSESAWARTYRLVGPDRSSYLKVLPPVQRSAVTRMLAIAERFVEHLPAVIAAVPEEGWILCADHGGRDLCDDAQGDDELLDVLRGYAALQAAATSSPATLGALESVRTERLVDELLAFLARPATSGDDPDAEVGVAHFVGESEAARYRRLFGMKAATLAAHVSGGARLPDTVCHGDLHRWNVAIRPDGSVAFFDWDEVAAGPAGLCLHGLFEGCTHATLLLDRMARGESLPDGSLASRLGVYVETLRACGYAPRERLIAGLPAAMCAGVLRFVASFGRYPDPVHRESAARTIRARLSDLLDLCDWLSSRSMHDALECVDAYERTSEWRRAHRLVQDCLSRSPRDVSLLVRYGRLSWQLDDPSTAGEAFGEAIAISPGHADAAVGLARTMLARLDLAGSAERVRAVLDQDPAHGPALELAGRIDRMAAAVAAAERPDGLPRWEISPREQAEGRLEPDTLALLVAMFRRHGVVQVDGVFPADLIAGLQGGFAQRYGEHCHDGEHADALQVGDRRFMLTMTLDDVFGTPELVASPLLMPVMRSVLGRECILGAYTAVVALPGAQDQTIHKDHSELFEEEGWQLAHPSFAAQVIVPLLDLDARTGATRMFKGSQRIPLRRCAELPHQDPEVPLGSCVLLDYSVAHLGRGNRSDRVRPILNLIYSRRWFRDCRNYLIQPPLRLAPGFMDTASDDLRALVDWWAIECAAADAGRPERA